MKYQQLERNNSSLDQKDQAGERQIKEVLDNTKLLSNEDRLFNSVKVTKKTETPTLRLTVAEDVRDTFVRSQIGSDQGMENGAYQS